MKKQLLSLFRIILRSNLSIWLMTVPILGATVSEVTTFSALKALDPASVDNVITVRYRAIAGDGGGGFFLGLSRYDNK
jgi:hypothetical protein